VNWEQGNITVETTPAQLYNQYPDLLKKYKENANTWKAFESYWGRMRKDERKKRNENGGESTNNGRQRYY
jgi:hypothetical protein